MKKQVVLRSKIDTQNFGIELSASGMLSAGAVVALSGPLGVGKTELAKGIAQGLGIMVPITSPTFGLAKEYPFCGTGGGEHKLIHIDAYRLDEINQTDRELLLEYLADENNLIVVEWAEKIAALLPAEVVKIDMSFGAEADGEESAEESAEEGANARICTVTT